MSRGFDHLRWYWKGRTGSGADGTEQRRRSYELVGQCSIDFDYRCCRSGCCTLAYQENQSGLVAMATFLDWLGGFIPIGETPDPFAPFRNPTDLPTPGIHADTGEVIVPMFKRPQRFVTPLLPILPLYDSSFPSQE